MLIYDHIPSNSTSSSSSSFSFSSSSYDSKENANNNNINNNNNNNNLVISATKFSAKLQDNIAETVIKDNLEFVNFGNLIEQAHLNFTSEFLQFSFEHIQ